MSRRSLFKGAVLGAAAWGLGRAVAEETPAGLRIERIDLFPVRYPTVMRFKFFEGPVSGGGRPAVLIKITASDGTVGWGESVPIPRWSDETLEGAVAALERYLIPVLLGRDPFDLDGIHAAMNAEIANGYSTGAPITKAGVDIALHDLLGKCTGKNIAALWGRDTPEDLLLSWTLNPARLDEVPELIERGRARGYAHFNVKVAPDPDYDLALCRMVKELVPDGFLWADANGGYDLDTALAVAPKLADLGVPVLEQPLPINQIGGYQALKRQGALPIFVDEGMVSPVELEEYYRLGCADGVAMKPARCGGLRSARRQIELTLAQGRPFLGSGLTDPDVSLAASLILYGAYGLARPAALNGPQFLGASVLETPLTPGGGRVRIPKGPGLGITVDESKVAALVEAGKA